MKISIMTDVKPSGKLKRIIKKTAAAAEELYGESGDVSVLLTDDETIKALNSDFRDIDKATDVLSFPSDEDGFYGDIAISIDKAEAQANEYGHSLEREIAFLTAHAMLHLFGYDHMEEQEEKDMREKQREILKKAGYDIQ